MRMSVIVATLRGCAAEQVDDRAYVEEALRRAVVAGGFELLHCYCHAFEPQGVTAAAVLCESHIALHSWPEEGALFVDIASCTGAEGAERAFQSICEHFSHATVQWHPTHRPLGGPPEADPAEGTGSREPC